MGRKKARYEERREWMEGSEWVRRRVRSSGRGEIKKERQEEVAMRGGK